MTNRGNPQVDMAAIKELNVTNPAAKPAFGYFAACQRNRSETTVNRLLSVLVSRGQKVSYGQVRDFLRDLARLDCGKYVMGRRGQPSRLEWRVGLVSLGQAAAGQAAQIEPLTVEEASGLNDEPEEGTTGRLSPDDMNLSYPLRRDRLVELTLPKDITPTEAQRLADFIKTLQFE